MREKDSASSSLEAQPAQYGVDPAMLGACDFAYALVFGCACSLAIPFTDLADLRTVDLVAGIACQVAYVWGFLPGIAGLLRSDRLLAVHLVWVAVVVVVVVAACLIALSGDLGPCDFIFTLVIYLAWPLLSIPLSLMVE